MLKHILKSASPSDHASPLAISLSEILEQLGLNTTSSSTDLAEACQGVIDDLSDVAETIRKGNEKPVMRLVGEVMKKSKGRADPKEARRILLELLSR